MDWMTPAKISTSFVNYTLSKALNKKCILVWRSIGSNIFFEFGIPEIKRIKHADNTSKIVVRGQIAIGIHTDDWVIQAEDIQILNSDEANDENIKKISEVYFLDRPLPKITYTDNHGLFLSFDENLSVLIQKDLSSKIKNFEDSDFTIYFEDGNGFDFNFEVGHFYTD